MPTPYIGELGALGLAKEGSINVFTAPTEFLPVELPVNVGSPDINLIESKGIYSRPDLTNKVAQGAAHLKDGKFKWNVEPENCGNALMAAFGTDTATETAAIVISTGVNDKIDFKENGGTTRTGTLVAGTYIMGTTSATASTLCKAVKTAMEAAPSAALTYTVTYSYTTKKVTITASSTTVQILWLTGANQATAAYAALGFSHTDTSASIAVTSDSTATVAMSHAFTRLSAAQLPTYSLWVSDNGLTYPEFTGCMLHKLDIEVKPNDYVKMDASFMGQKYVTGGSTQSVSYSALNPFKFDQATVTVGGSPITLYEDVKISIDNMVHVDPVIGGSIYSNVIYTAGLKVSVAMTIVVEDTTEWTNFINGTASSLTLLLTSTQNITGVTKYTLSIAIGTINYKAAPLPLKSGKLQITFQADGVYNTTNSATITATLVNSVQVAY